MLNINQLMEDSANHHPYRGDIHYIYSIPTVHILYKKGARAPPYQLINDCRRSADSLVTIAW